MEKVNKTISEWCAEVASESVVEGVRGPGCLVSWEMVSSLKVMDGGTLVTRGTVGRLRGVESHYPEDSFLMSWKWSTERATED